MMYLTNLPLWLSAFILIVPTTLIAMAGPFVTRHYVELSRLRTNNEVAGFKFATVGVLYAVLLAFAVVVVWEKFNEADSEVAKEAGAASTIFLLTRGIDEKHGAAIRKATTEYLNAAIAKDWPAMARETDSPDVTESAERHLPRGAQIPRVRVRTKASSSPRSSGRSIASATRGANAWSGRRHHAGHHLGGAVRRRRRDHRLYVLLRH